MIADDALPAVTIEESLGDLAFFDANPRRQYRMRPGWAVRRRSGGVFLRTQLVDARRYPDHERLAEQMWWAAAFPHLSPLARAAHAKAARWNTKPLHAVATPAKAATPTGEALLVIPRAGGKP